MNDHPPIVFITGASRGIGAATAAAFVARGHRVAATHRGSGVPVDGVHSVKMDVTDEASIESGIAEVESIYGPPEILIHNAGSNRDKLLLRMTEDDFRAPFETNTVGAYRLIKRILPGMLKAKRGSIVLVSSASAYAGQPGQANYAASKAALEGLARSVMREYASKNIRCNIVVPGGTETDMTATLSEGQREAMLAQIPMRRLARPDEIAEAVAAVAMMPYMTGATVAVTGGAAVGL